MEEERSRVNKKNDIIQVFRKNTITKRSDVKSFLFFIRNLAFVYVILSIYLVEGKRYHDRLLSMPSRIKSRRLGFSREEFQPKVCYGELGCFANSPLSWMRPPEDPDVIQTKFFLYSRANRNSPKVIKYADQSQSLIQSGFNISSQLKIIVHGYKGSGSDQGLIRGINAFLDLEDVNVLVVDWTRGAGTNYATAVSNTELVGRQLALVLLDAFNLGVKPMDVHATGFSLGAHVAGCASEMLKKRRGLLLGRITGLDPASPFFRHNILRQKSKKLDATDAHLVDIIHTDGSEYFTDGFGLLKPIGHIDFFPNGGKEQPGCTDVQNSVIVSHLNAELLDRQIACSHLRAWQLFVESILTQSQQCKFIAWPCPQGISSFTRGTCFPMESTDWSQEMGYKMNNAPLGIYFLVTRAESPFCGEPFRVTAMTAKGAPKTMGILILKTFHDNSTTTYKINCLLPKLYNHPEVFYNIMANEYSLNSGNVTVIKGSLQYHNKVEANEINKTRLNSDTLLLDKLFVENRKGDRWEYCNLRAPIGMEEIEVELQKTPCMQH